MTRTPEENEATLHRAVEKAQRDRWEPEDDEDEEQVHCEQCDTLIGYDEIVWQGNERFCSTSCVNKYQLDELGEEE